MRVGIFGGTFDPPHTGHLIAASVPTGTQPLKAGKEISGAADRVAMVRLLVAGDERFSVDSLEIDRGGLSFTVDTLRTLRQRWPAGTAGMTVLLGADAAAQFPQWKDPTAVQALAEVVVLTRGDASVSLPQGLRGITTRRVDISSTEIRERVKAGKPVRAFVTEPVAAYIARAGLYR